MKRIGPMVVAVMAVLGGGSVFVPRATAQTTISFGNEAVGSLPASFETALSGKGAAGVWKVVVDRFARPKRNVLAQLHADKTSYRFPVCVYRSFSAKDVDLQVRFRPISGKVDQAAGLVWRYQNKDNYYVVRANALEHNVVLYKVEQGKRKDLPLLGLGRTYGKKAKVMSGRWSVLRVVAKGARFTVYLNGRQLYQVEDKTFPNAGKVGLWTKADSITHFDQLSFKALTP